MFVGYGFPTPETDMFCCDLHFERFDDGWIGLVCKEDERLWNISFGFGVTESCLKLGSLFWRGILTALEAEESE